MIQNLPQNEPVLLQTLLLAVINLLLVFGIIHWSTDQIAAVNAVLVAVLGAIVRTQVTPIKKGGSASGSTSSGPAAVSGP